MYSELSHSTLRGSAGGVGNESIHYPTNMKPLVSLYGIIADLRREHPTPATMQTLDMVVAELGRTRDNLHDAAVS